MDFNNTVSVCF